MIAPWNRRSVFIDFSLENAKKIQESLKESGIETHSVKASNSRARARGIYLGFDSTICKDPETAYTYYIYVHRKNIKEARILAEQVLAESDEADSEPDESSGGR